MGDRAQASIEFVLVIAFGMVILLPASLIFANYSRESSEELKMTQLIRMGNDIVLQSENVYYYSDPSRVEIIGVVPDGVKSIYVQTDWANHVNLLTFNLQKGDKIQPVTFFSRVNMNGTFEARDFTPGRKRILLEVKRKGNEPYVDIDFK